MPNGVSVEFSSHTRSPQFCVRVGLRILHLPLLMLMMMPEILKLLEQNPKQSMVGPWIFAIVWRLLHLNRLTIFIIIIILCLSYIFIGITL